MALLVFTVPVGSCQRWHSETIDLLKMKFLAGAQWQWRAIHSLKIWNDKEAEACTGPIKRRKKKEREKGSEGTRRGKKRTIQYINAIEIYTIFPRFQLSSQLEVLHKIKHLQTTWGHFGDNCPNVVAQTGLFVSEIFSCKWTKTAWILCVWQREHGSLGTGVIKRYLSVASSLFL